LFYWSECSVIQQIFNPFIDNLYMYENWPTIFNTFAPQKKDWLSLVDLLLISYFWFIEKKLLFGQKRNKILLLVYIEKLS
jgi:hypothetical protein